MMIYEYIACALLLIGITLMAMLMTGCGSSCGFRTETGEQVEHDCANTRKHVEDDAICGGYIDIDWGWSNSPVGQPG